MASTLIGTASVFALDGVTVAYTSPAGVVGTPTGINFSDSASQAKAADASGQTFAVGFTEFEHSITVDLMRITDGTPGTTRQGAKDEVVLPAIGTKITLAGFETGSSGTLINGDWNYVGGGTVNLSNNGFMKATLPLKRFGATPAYMAPVS